MFFFDRDYNICRTVGVFFNRDKKILLEYVASVEIALKTADGGSTNRPSDELLPTELGVVVSTKRQSSGLKCCCTTTTTI